MNTTPQPELIPKGPGDILRQEREKRRWTVDFLAQALKVRPEIVMSIESGDTGRIPPVYLKGYMRSYAREVGIPQDVIDGYLSKSTTGDPAVQSIFKEGLPRNNGDRWFKASSYVLASAVVIALVWQFTNEAVRFSQGDPMLRTSQGNTGATASDKDSSRDNASSGSFAGESLPGKTHLRASIASMSGTGEQISPQRPLVAEDAWAAIGNHDAATNQAAPGLPGSEKLEVTTSADSWIEIFDGNDARVEMDLLRAGSRRSYTGTAPFHLLLGRASSVEVFHNGQKVNLAPYIRGNVARLTLGGTESASEDASVTAVEPPPGESASPDQG